MKSKRLTSVVAAYITLAGASYLAATPSSASATSFDCLQQAIALHAMMASFCRTGEADCSFHCTADNSAVQSMSCSCM